MLEYKFVTIATFQPFHYNFLIRPTPSAPLFLTVLMQDLKYRRVELFDGIDWQHFRDGWPNIFIKNVKLIAGRDG